jgi:hypothetical protein
MQPGPNILIQTKVQLRAIIHGHNIFVAYKWKKVGPCGDFCESPAVKFLAGDSTYIVLMSKADFDAFYELETSGD